MSTSPPPPRKFPPLCWTPHETLALLHAFRDRWFSLRRRNLRSPDWDAVAADLSRRCPSPSLPKSSLQCRHKIEKLRKRYRSEKNRSLASSWDLFPLLDSMQIGAVGSRLSAQVCPNLDDEAELGGRFGGIQVGDHHFDSNSGAAGYRLQIIRPQSKVNGNYGSNLNFDYNVGLGLRNVIPPGFRSRNHDNYDWNVDSGIRNGGPSSSRYGTTGVKRKVDQVAEMVSSIKILGEGFVRMEEMKMETVREIEKMRLEAEMKRTEMIIKSQERIVDVFVNALLGNEKKVKMEEVTD